MDWKRAILISTLAMGLLLSACGQQMTPEDQPEAVEAAESALSARLGVDQDQIEVISYEEKEWPDACLGLAESDEMCAQVITPGYEVVMEVDGESYVARPTMSGDQVRFEA